MTKRLLQFTFALALFGSLVAVGYSDSHSEAKPAPAIPTTPAGLMKYFEGEWAAAGELYMGGQTMPFPGGAKFSTVYNHYVQQEFEANAGGMPFKGRGMMAYDADKKVWQFTWIDVMNKTINYHTSTYDAATKTWEGKFDDKGQMGPISVRTTMTINSHDKFTMLNYQTAKTEGAKEAKQMQIVYTRKAK